MRFKLIMALVDDNQTDAVVDAAREAGATGATVLTGCRGEGLTRGKTFFGLDLTGQRDMLLFVVEQHMARQILEVVAKVAGFDEQPGRGIALTLDVEDAVGLGQQIQTIREEIEEEI